MLTVIVANKAVIVSALLAISELLALSPKIKSNSIFQLVVAGLKKVKDVLATAFVG